MSAQLCLDFDQAPAVELLEYRHPSGRPKIQILTAATPEGFVFGLTAWFATAGFAGMPAKPSDFFGARIDALKAAIVELMRLIAKPDSYGTAREIELVRAWTREVVS